ncbi:hypothetical protein EHW66_19845 [Erwinia psidii]|uniref:hypothetical protein n=1 Tax=Erwinia psidii TaxID=69224 RepID=UPI00226BA62A|nr:hypothetical protein [Erwinia psidii]MCX8967146.1 hypothetical protein [Erwinia psidii]
MNSFEMFTKLNYTTAREMAFVLMGLDYEILQSSLTAEQSADHQRISRAISRNVNYYEKRERKQNISKVTDADHVSAAAYPFVIDGVTPHLIVEHIDKAIIKITRESGWKDKLEKLGGESLLNRGKVFYTGGRGDYKKNDEARGNYKMIAVLIKMLAENGKKNYGSFSKPLVSEIYKDLSKLCSVNGIDLKGLAESTFYKKVKEANSFLNE